MEDLEHEVGRVGRPRVINFIMRPKGKVGRLESRRPHALRVSSEVQLQQVLLPATLRVPNAWHVVSSPRQSGSVHSSRLGASMPKWKKLGGKNSGTVPEFFGSSTSFSPAIPLHLCARSNSGRPSNLLVIRNLEIFFRPKSGLNFIFRQTEVLWLGVNDSPTRKPPESNWLTP